MVEWTEIGEFETACKECGAVIEPVVFLVIRENKKRYLRRGDHFCAGEGDEEMRIQRATAAHLTFLDNPDHATIRHHQNGCHLPDRFHAGLHRLTVDQDNEAAIGAAHAMLGAFQGGDRSRGLYLHGEVGTGKSAISKALAYDLAARTGNHIPLGWKLPVVQWGPPARVQWWAVPQLFSEMGRRWDNQPSDYDPDRLERCDCLILDDLGKEYPTGFKRTELFRIVNGRYDAARALVITSNYAPTELAARIVEAAERAGEDAVRDTEALFDRIGEVCEVVELAGESRRPVARRRAA